VLDYARRIEGKIEFRDNAALFPEETSIPQGSQKDVFIVRLAVETRAILVTTDIPLRNALNSCGVQEAHNLQVLSPNDALHQL
jgi:rRNA-processing protein FCF1